MLLLLLLSFRCCYFMAAKWSVRSERTFQNNKSFCQLLHLSASCRSTSSTRRSTCSCGSGSASWPRSPSSTSCGTSASSSWTARGPPSSSGRSGHRECILRHYVLVLTSVCGDEGCCFFFWRRFKRSPLYFCFSPRRDELKVDVAFVVRHLDYGDWKLLYHLLRYEHFRFLAETSCTTITFLNFQTNFPYIFPNANAIIECAGIKETWKKLPLFETPCN